MAKWILGIFTIIVLLLSIKSFAQTIVQQSDGDHYFDTNTNTYFSYQQQCIQAKSACENYMQVYDADCNAIQSNSYNAIAQTASYQSVQASLSAGKASLQGN